MKIEIDNLTEAQALAIEDMLAMWRRLGGMGSSRWTGILFFADGDGNFRPQISVDGHVPQPCTLGHPLDRWRQVATLEKKKSSWLERLLRLAPCLIWRPLQTSYLLDFDEIAWALRKQKAEQK